MREGQGSYFHAQKNKLFVGEYVEDIPKAGIYTEVDDGSGETKGAEEKLRDFDDIPPIPKLGLRDPIKVLEASFKRTRMRRIFYRAKFMSIAQMFQKEELNEMLLEFSKIGESSISHEQLLYLLEVIGIEIDPSLLPDFISKITQEVPSSVNFELFVRTVAIILEENNKLPDEALDEFEIEEEIEE